MPLASWPPLEVLWRPYRPWGNVMRIALTSLIVAAGLVGAAQAQPAAAPPAPGAAAAPPPAQPAAPAQPAPTPPPQLPTAGDGAAVISALERICVPAVRGQGLDAAAKAAGLRRNRRDGT